MSGYYIAIDGGGSRSRGLIARGNMEVLHRAAGKGANYHLVGADRVEEALFSLIESLCRSAGVSLEQVEGFCFALAGVSRPADHGTIGRVLRRHRIDGRSKVISDAEAALLGGTAKGVGVAVIAGTGSVVFGRNESGETKKVAGVGHLLGDPGSGYDVGIRGLRAVIAASEGRGEKTELSHALLNAISLEAVEMIVPWLYSLEDPKAAVAGLAPVVIACAERNDAAAGKILRDAAEELAEAVCFAVNWLGLSGAGLDIVLCGGVLENNATYFHLMESAISDTLPTARPVRPRNDAAFGALVALLGRRNSPVIDASNCSPEK
jgi:N-acetylglucosamine kinase-like BadF-type ATPase